MTFRSFSPSILGLLILVNALPAIALERVALVVGNGQYDRASNVLINPPNDARAIAAKLEGLGVQVITAIDQDFAGMRRSLSAFGRALKDADAGIFYYAGHGMEYDGTNYLFPIDARLNTESDVHLDLISVDQVLQVMESEVATRLVFLDACRDNPMARSFNRDSSLSRSSGSGGLASVQASVGTFIAYATAPGQIAADGRGNNSPFTTAMLDQLDVPGLEISQLMRRVRNAVLDMTNDMQVPWESSSLRGSPFIFNQQEPKPSVQQGDDIATWMTIEKSDNPQDFRQFLEQFPNSSLSGFIRSRLNELTISQGAPGLEEDKTAITRPYRFAPEKTSPIQSTVAVAPLKVGDLPVGESPLAGVAGPGSVTKPVIGPVKPGQVLVDCEICPELVAVAPGKLIMGSPGNEPGRDADEGPVRGVALGKALAFGRLEVTFDQWDACVAAGGCNGYLPSDEGWGRGNRPVINVNHEDARAYTAWLIQQTGKAYRLPSEAEWEYAARAGIMSATPWSVSNQQACAFANIHDRSSEAANRVRWDAFSCDDGTAQTAPAGAYLANGFGLHDMLGNVWEWTADCYSPNLDQVRGDGIATASADCAAYVLRGGGWRDRIDDIRLASRAKGRVSSRTSIDGFRVVRDLSEGLDAEIPISGRQ